MITMLEVSGHSTASHYRRQQAVIQPDKMPAGEDFSNWRYEL